MKIENMLGYKIFKETEDDIIIYRIIKIKQRNSESFLLTVKDVFSNEIKEFKSEELKDFTPLTPDGYMTFSIVYILDENNNKLQDVVVTASKMLNLKIGDTLPYAVCRQSCTDIFHNLLCKSEDDMIVGLAVNQDDCPTNFDFREIMACDGIDYSQHINTYRTDTLFDDILPIIKTNKLNKVMEANYIRHAKATGDSKTMFKSEDKGWCKDINILLKENNFQWDIDQMFNIYAVIFDMSEEIVKKPLPGKEGEEYDSINDDLKAWFSSIFKININNISIIEYGYDIDLAKFNNSKYFLIRDNKNKLYLLVYTEDREELEIDLTNKAAELDFSTKYALDFYNKYNQYNKDKE